PRGAAVRRLPQPAARRAEVVLERPGRAAGHGDRAAAPVRAHVAPLETVEQARVVGDGGRRGRARRGTPRLRERLLRERGDGNQHRDQRGGKRLERSDSSHTIHPFLRVVGRPVRCGSGGWGARLRNGSARWVAAADAPGRAVPRSTVRRTVGSYPRGRLWDCQTPDQTSRYGRGALLWQAPLRMSDPT